MKCKYCGYSLSNNSATCPHCGMLMTEDQLKKRKELNGYNNPYMQRLNKLNEEKVKNKLYESEQIKNIGGYILIVIALIVVTIICVFIFKSR